MSVEADQRRRAAEHVPAVSGRVIVAARVRARVHVRVHALDAAQAQAVG